MSKNVLGLFLFRATTCHVIGGFSVYHYNSKNLLNAKSETVTIPGISITIKNDEVPNVLKTAKKLTSSSFFNNTKYDYSCFLAYFLFALT